MAITEVSFSEEDWGNAPAQSRDVPTGDAGPYPLARLPGRSNLLLLDQLQHSTNMNDADHLPDDTAIRALAENGMHETRTRRRRRTTGLVTARQQAVQWVDGTTL